MVLIQLQLPPLGSIQSVAEAHSKISPIYGDVTSQKDDLINFISTFHGGIVTILSFAVMQMESIGFLDKLDPYLCVSVSDTTLKTEPQIDAGDRATWEEISYEVPCTEVTTIVIITTITITSTKVATKY